MAKTSDITVEILKQIRDGVYATNVRLDDVTERLERVEKRQTETEIHLATELVAVVGAVGSLRDAILEDRHLRGQVADHESRLRRLERRTG